MIDMDYFWELDKKDKEERAKFEAELKEIRRKELAEKGLTLQEPRPMTKEEEFRNHYGWCEHPNTMENGTATVVWIAAMIISLLFKGGWVLCILETIIWFKHITRHNDK